MIDKNELIELYNVQKMTMKEISKYLGVSIGSVHNYIKKYGIKSRPRMTDEVKKRISKTKTGVPSKLKGVKRTEETKKKISESKKGKFFKKSKYGGHTKTRSDGYIAVYVPQHPGANKDGYVMEHILVMEEHIGRYLTEDEVVHHVNRNRSDNRIENLRLMTFSEHASIHMKERWENKKGEVDG